MDSLGPFAFNGIRFLLGAAPLLPLLKFGKKIMPVKEISGKESLWTAGIISGIVLFFAASTQQFGIVFTTAGNAGFITSLYVILVPVFSVFLGQRTKTKTWFAAILAVVGLYLLSVNEGVNISFGNLLVLGSAFVWTVQVLLAGYYSVRHDIIKLAIIQFTLTGVLSLLISFFTESYNWSNIFDATIPLLYGGIMSVGIAFTIQLIGQRKAIPSHAAIILGTESVFAAIGGWLLLNEILSGKELMGAALILVGVILSQIPGFSLKKPHQA
jgi:drug/metabolite transporter (DMT)-like permease